MDGDPVYLRLVVQVKSVFAWRLDFKAVSVAGDLQIFDLIGKDKHTVGRTRTKAFPIDVKAGAEPDRGSASLICDRQVLLVQSFGVLFPLTFFPLGVWGGSAYGFYWLCAVVQSAVIYYGKDLFDQSRTSYLRSLVSFFLFAIAVGIL